mmetsp:Transcript_39354/g.37795  ORF Transcript_39354/g.37795 Transcript_39354/m.37795 type:complete len:103 (+) Transcript_39354:157-465(+)
MEKLSENQINEGVVYFQNGIGYPNPHRHPLSKKMLSSMATASSSIFSNQLGQANKRNLSNAMLQKKNKLVHQSYLNQPLKQGGNSRNYSQTSYKSMAPKGSS